MKVDGLLAALSLDEKAALTAGADMWTTTPIDRLGIPALKMTDGPNGARGSALFGAGSATAACIPCGSALGATWNPVLVERLGRMLGEEARSKGCRILLAPTINLHRSPLAGRNFECPSEDPILSGRIAAGFIRGVQSRGVAATAKHLVANDSEDERYTTSSTVDERTLREIYLLPFEIAVREAGVLAVMTGYNRLNGTYCSEHQWLLQTVLKEQWGFTGIVMSDWFSAGDTVASARAGLDLQMPGPARFFGPPLAAAVAGGAVPAIALDDKVRRLLRVVDRLDAWQDGAAGDEQSVDRPEHRALAREAACEATVLLRNDGILPLQAKAASSLAAIGPAWGRANLMGGGSAQLRPHYRIAPIEELRQRAAGMEIVHEPGCTIDRTAPPLGRPRVRTANDEPGFEVEFFASEDCSGPVAHRARFDEASLFFFGAPAAGVAESCFSLRAVGELTVDRSGEHQLTLAQAGRARVWIDDRLILDGASQPPPPGSRFFGMASEEISAGVELNAGSTARIVLEYSSRESFFLRGALLGYRPPSSPDPLADAAAAAARADVAVVMVGTDHEWESEGHDRRSMDLPGEQNELIERVLAANPNTVVVVNAGAPVTMDWAERARACLCVWLGGQEMAGAVADVLFGHAEPAGRLPTTIPLRLEHNPSFANFPVENGEILYGERLLVGYRWFDTRSLPVRFPFGHGLSYTAFEIGAPRLTPGDGPLDFDLEVEVRNGGARRGAEVVQCYVSPRACRLARPAKELRAFAKVWLEPGEEKDVALHLDARAFAYWDPCFPQRAELADKMGDVAAMLPGGVACDGRTTPGWYVDAGVYDVLIGRSAAEILHGAVVTVEEDLGPL
jgi:beta-glucosidase